MSKEELIKRISELETFIKQHRKNHKLDEEPFTFTKAMKDPVDLESILYFYKMKLSKIEREENEQRF